MMNNRVISILKKAILQLAIFTALFSSAAFMCSSNNNTSYSSFASFLVNQRVKNSLPFNYGKVESGSLQDYTSFYWYADDIPGSNIREGMHTFFKAFQDNEDLYSFSYEEKVIKAETLLFTTWDFKNYHYGFNIFSNQEKLGLKTGEVYITESIANQLFEDCHNDFNLIIDKTITCNNSTITIKGVIIEDSLGFFDLTVGKSFILGNFNYKPFPTNKLIYNFIMFGSEVDTFADIVCIEGTILSLNSNKKALESFYYDYNGSFVLEESQAIKNSTITNQNKDGFLKVTSIILFVILTIVLILYFTVGGKIIKNINDVFKNQRINNIFDYFTSLFGFLLVLLILKIIGLIRIGDTIINLFDFNIVTPVFATWIVVSVSILVINTHFKNGRDKNLVNKNKDYYEIRV